MRQTNAPSPRGVVVEATKGRTVFIGDIHGCYEETVALLKKLQLTPNDHVLWLGDYVDRGPESAKCCDLVRQREQVQGKVAGILGNHEERHLHYVDAIKDGREPGNMPPTHVATRIQLNAEHYDWFRTLPLYVRVPAHNIVAVHAGVFPGRSIEEQRARTLLHVQMIKPYDYVNGRRVTSLELDRSVWPSKVPQGDVGWKFWTHFWDGPEFIVFGHSVLDRPLITDKVAGIDGGAVFGRQLHAFVVDGDTRSIVTVDSATDYGKGSRGRGSDKIKTFEIHEGVNTYS